jgi:large subunit ribosomal protein L13
MSSNPRFARPLWHLVDARGQVVGRLATQLVHILKGKHKPTFSPNYDCGDYVVVINAAEVKLTGNKVEDKKYRWHTGYPGGLKERTATQQLARNPEEILRKAVLGMMAKNNLRNLISTKLRIFPGENHLHVDKLPEGTLPINQPPVIPSPK